MPVEGPFRCLRCGGLGEIDAPGMLTLGIKGRPIDATAPSCPCGGRRWVRAYTMSEYYLWRRRPEVCYVGNHVDARTRKISLVPRRPPDPAPPPPGHVTLLGLDVQVCPDHMDELRARGMHGFFPEEK
jgi:hypothetical protein